MSASLCPQANCYIVELRARQTSIISLSRLYEIQKGEILIDGIKIRDIRKDDLRRMISVVLQDVFPFSGRLKDNIRPQRGKHHRREDPGSTRYVNADGFISRLPKG